MTPLSPDQIAQKVDLLKKRYANRDSRFADVSAVRRGDYRSASPGTFPDDIPAEIVANAVEAYARDMAESMAGLPAFNCSSSNMKSDQARTRADKRTKIVSYYLAHSKLAKQMLAGADHYTTFAFVAGYVEPDFDAKCPRITIEPSIGGYPEFNRWGDVVSFAREYDKTVGELVSMFPELELRIRGEGPNARDDNARMKMVRYCDETTTTVYLPQQGFSRSMALSSYDHKLGECPVKIAARPMWDDEMRGQFDSVIWVQVARARMAQLAWDAAETAVNAPIVATPDMQEMAFGDGAILYSNNPEKVRRLPLEIPQSSFAEMANLGNELRLGARYPEGRTGNLSASVVTGRGVQELNAGFDTQIASAQANFVPWFEDITRLAFKMDEAYWPEDEKTIRGTQNDAPYEIRYKPSRDIAGDHTVDIQYGMAMGLDPNRAIVMLLQLRGDEAISRDFFMRQLPFQINVTDENQKIQVEKTRDAIMASIQGLAGSLPDLAAQGQDPTAVAAKLALVIDRLQKGKQLEDAFLEAFKPPETPPAPEGAPTAPGEASPPAGDPLADLATGGGAGPGAGGPTAPTDLATALTTLTSGGEASARTTTQRNRVI